MEGYVILSALALLVLGVEAGKCPANPAKEMQECAAKININLNIAEGHKFITDPEFTEKMCSGEEANKVIKCMEVIYDDCKSSIADKDLMMKPVAWKAAIKMLCDNKNFLANNSACVHESIKDALPCVQKFSKQAEEDVNFKKIDLASKVQSKQRAVYKIICKLANQLITCFDDTLHKRCPKKMEQLVNDVLYMFLPPVCHPEDAAYKTVKEVEDDKGKGENSSATSSASVMAILMLCLTHLF